MIIFLDRKYCVSPASTSRPHEVPGKIIGDLLVDGQDSRLRARVLMRTTSTRIQSWYADWEALFIYIWYIYLYTAEFGERDLRLPPRRHIRPVRPRRLLGALLVGPSERLSRDEEGPVRVSHVRLVDYRGGVRPNDAANGHEEPGNQLC